MRFRCSCVPGCPSLVVLAVSQAALFASQTFPRSAPEPQGVSSAGVLNFVNAVEAGRMNLHSLMLVRHGQVVAEGWWAPYSHDLKHTLYSLSKSFTSTAVGMAVDEGRLSLDDKVVSFFPNDLPSAVSPNLAEMRVKHLLMMGTGHKFCALFGSGFSVPEGDWIRLALSRPVEFEPGTHFVYNTGATFMLSAIIQRATGQTLLDYLNPRLFKPLGIDDAEWGLNPQGLNTGGWGLRLKTEDIAKLGQLYLQNGMWRGKRILSETWVREATKAQIKNASGDPAKDAVSDWAQGYGYQFWRCRHGAFRADGAFGQYCIVFPQHDAVLAMTAETNDMQVILNAVWEHLLPAMQAQRLPPDDNARTKLGAKLASLSLPFPDGKATSPQAARVNKQTYAIARNPLGVRSVSLAFHDDKCAFTMLDAKGEHKIKCGIGRWQCGETDLSPAPLHLATTEKFGKSPLACSSAWSDDHTFVMLWRFIGTAHYQSVTCSFEGDDIRVEFRKSAVILNPSAKDGRPVLTGKLLAAK